MRLFFLAIITLSLHYNALSDSWDDIRLKGLENGGEYNLTVGTGFFINSHQIITNKHVVNNCSNIAVRGAIKPSCARLKAFNLAHDLALLEVRNPTNNIPYLRLNYNQIQSGDVVFTIGYPLKNGYSGKYIMKQGHVLAVDNAKEGGYIKFEDIVDHGNSGGPLLDRSGNIIGVVAAKETESAHSNIVKSVGLAVSLNSLIGFLDKYNITYYTNSTYDVFTNYKPDIIAQNYIVNIHCVSY